MKPLSERLLYLMADNGIKQSNEPLQDLRDFEEYHGAIRSHLNKVREILEEGYSNPDPVEMAVAGTDALSYLLENYV